MFDLSGTDRLIEWRRFRDSLETSNTPLKDVAELWSRAPFVSSYLDPHTPDQWPDPWHIILDEKLDNLAIVLGMLYTLQLTQRFMNYHFEIHMSTQEKTKDTDYFLIVDKSVLNLEYGSVVDINLLEKIPTSKIWAS